MKFKDSSIIGLKEKTFLLETSCDGCDVFQIDIGKGVRTKEQEQQYYLDYAIEKYTENPTYLNDTDITIIEDKDEKGISTHLLSIDSTAIGIQI